MIEIGNELPAIIEKMLKVGKIIVAGGIPLGPICRGGSRTIPISTTAIAVPRR